MLAQEPLLLLRILIGLVFPSQRLTVQHVKVVRDFSASQRPDPVVEEGGEHL